MSTHLEKVENIDNQLTYVHDMMTSFFTEQTNMNLRRYVMERLAEVFFDPLFKFSMPPIKERDVA